MSRGELFLVLCMAGAIQDSLELNMNCNNTTTTERACTYTLTALCE
jgi:hypothetical protein